MSDREPRRRNGDRKPTPEDREHKPPRQSDGQRRVALSQVLRAATSDFAELVGKPPEGVSGVERTDDGWLVSVEVTELERIPPSTSVMATYEMDVDADGEVQSYRRVRRYYRSQATEA